MAYGVPRPEIGYEPQLWPTPQQQPRRIGWAHCTTAVKFSWAFLDTNVPVIVFFQPLVAIPLLGIYPKNTKTPIQKDICIHMFIVALFIIAKVWKQFIINGWMDKDGVLLSHIKKKEILPFAATCMDLEGIMLREISHTEKDKYSVISFIYEI